MKPFTFVDDHDWWPKGELLYEAHLHPLDQRVLRTESGVLSLAHPEQPEGMRPPGLAEMIEVCISVDKGHRDSVISTLVEHASHGGFNCLVPLAPQRSNIRRSLGVNVRGTQTRLALDAPWEPKLSFAHIFSADDGTVLSEMFEDVEWPAHNRILARIFATVCKARGLMSSTVEYWGREVRKKLKN